MSSMKQFLGLMLAVGMSVTLHTIDLIVVGGNYMNGGTNKGQAHGIKLSGLVSLISCIS
jgi:hypothetical protein